MMGMGGATALSICRGQGKEEEANSYFTAAVLFTCIFSLIIGILGAVFWRPIAYLGGADDSIIELVGQYLRILNGGAGYSVCSEQFSWVFIRNDHDPQRVMAAGIVSCLLNIVLDYVCIFLFDWGMAGAAGATAFSGFISILIMLTHFLKPDCSLKFRFSDLQLFLASQANLAEWSSKLDCGMFFGTHHPFVQHPADEQGWCCCRHLLQHYFQRCLPVPSCLYWHQLHLTATVEHQCRRRKYSSCQTVFPSRSRYCAVRFAVLCFNR